MTVIIVLVNNLVKFVIIRVVNAKIVKIFKFFKQKSFRKLREYVAIVLKVAYKNIVFALKVNKNAVFNVFA